VQQYLPFAFSDTVSDTASFVRSVARMGWNDLYDAVLGQWLWRLYRFGPMLTSFGFWSGLRDEEVCARLTSHTEVMDWLDPQTGSATHRCVTMIQRSFGAFEVTIHIALYCLLLFQLLSLITSWYRRRYMEQLLRSFAAVIHDANGATVTPASRTTSVAALPIPNNAWLCTACAPEGGCRCKQSCNTLRASGFAQQSVTPFVKEALAL
jgi:hypothetical protein